MGTVPLNQRMWHSENSKTRSRGRQSEGTQLEAQSRHPQAGTSRMNCRGKQLDAKGSKRSHYLTHQEQLLQRGHIGNNCLRT